MSKERCDNYDTCQKYGLYGKCEVESDDQLPSLHSFCNAHEKQVINILSSIDAKLGQLLDNKSDT